MHDTSTNYAYHCWASMQSVKGLYHIGSDIHSEKMMASMID